MVGQLQAVVGEACAALEGVRLAMERGWEEVVLEGDVLLLDYRSNTKSSG